MLRCRTRPDEAPETTAVGGADGVSAPEPATEAAAAVSTQAEADGDAVGETEAGPEAVEEEGADADGQPGPPLVPKRAHTRRVAAV